MRPDMYEKQIFPDYNQKIAQVFQKTFHLITELLCNQRLQAVFCN